MKLSPELEAKVLALSGEAAPTTSRPALVAATSAMRLTVVVPLKLTSAANKREHHMARHRRVKGEREAVKMAMLTNSYVNAALQGVTFEFRKSAGFRVVVTLTRLGGRKWDDDNNVSGLKATRDAVAQWWLLLDDGSDRVKFLYEQEPGGACGVRIELATAEA